MADDKYGVDFLDGVYDTHTGEYVKPEIETKKPLTFKHAQKLAMQYGDADTYFQRKTAKKKAAKRGQKR